MNAKTRALLPALVLAAVAALVFSDVLLGRRTVWNADVSAYHFPLHRELGEAIRRADPWPVVWNPANQAGFPVLAEGQIGPFYPLHWLTLALLPPLRSLDAVVVLSYWGCALGMSWFLRSVGTSRAAALFGAVAFAFGGFAASHVCHVSIVTTLPWLPVVLALAERAGRSRSWRAWLHVGLAWAVQALAGHPQVAVMTLLLAVVYVSHASLSGREPLLERGRRGLAALGLLGATGLSVAAVQLLPLRELGQESVRIGGRIPLESAVAFSLTPEDLLAAIAPFFLGGPVDYRGRWSLAETSFYAGAATLFLAPAAFLGPQRHRKALLFAAVLGVSLLLCLGDSTPLFAALHRLPGHGAFRAPARFAMLLDFALASLAALGVDALAAAEGGGAARRAALLGLSVATGLGLAWVFTDAPGVVPSVALLGVAAGWLASRPWLPRRAWLVVGLGLLVVDVAAYARRSQRPYLVDTGVALRRNPALSFLVGRTGLDRVYLVRGPAPWREPTNMLLLYGLHDLGGYSAVPLERHRAYLETFWWTGQTHRELLSLASVRWVVDTWGGAQEPMARFGPVAFRLAYPVAAVGGEGAPRAAAFHVGAPDVRGIAVVSNVLGVEDLPSGSEVARIVVTTPDGRRIFPLRKDVETGDGASSVPHERPAGAVLAYDGPILEGASRRRFYFARLGLEPGAVVEDLRLEHTSERGQLRVQGLAFLGSRGVLDLSPFMAEGYRAAARFPWGTVYENLGALPRAYAVHEVHRASNRVAAAEGLLSPAYRPGEHVVLEDPSAPTPTGSGPSAVEVIRYAPTEVRLRARMRGDGYVVLNDAAFPGWRARVDGEPAPVFTANVLFRAVPVADGDHEVIFDYAPGPLRWGAAWSATSLAVVLTLLAWRPRRRAQTD